MPDVEFTNLFAVVLIALLAPLLLAVTLSDRRVKLISVALRIPPDYRRQPLMIYEQFRPG